MKLGRNPRSSAMYLLRSSIPPFPPARALPLILTVLVVLLTSTVDGARSQDYDEAGGPDVLITSAADLTSYPPSIDIAENGDIYIAITGMSGGSPVIRVYRSQDTGDTWIIWGTIGIPGINVGFPCLHIGEGDQDRIYLAYRFRGPSDPNFQMWVAWSSMAGGTAAWNNRTVMAQTGVDFQSPSIHSDEMSNGSFKLYLVAMGSGIDGGDIWFARSTDFGDSWQDEYQIASSTTGDGLFYPEVRYGRGGVIHCVYYFNPTNTPGKDMAVRYRRALHYAAAGIADWQSIVNLTSDTDSHHEWHASVAGSHGDDTVVITYARRDTLDVFEPGHYRYSTDGGASWLFFNGGSFHDNMLPHLLAVAGTGNFSAYGSPDQSDNYGLMEARGADPEDWTANLSLMDRPYANVPTTPTGASYFDTNAAQGHRRAAVWMVYNSAGPDSLFFDAEWRRVPVGACCDALTGGCQVVPEPDCAAAGGEWFAGTPECDPNPCSPGPFLRFGDWINPEPWHNYVGPSTRPMRLEVELPTGAFPPISQVDFLYTTDGGFTWLVAGSDESGAEPILDTFGTSGASGDGWSVDFTVPSIFPPPPEIQFAVNIHTQARDVIHVETPAIGYDPLPPNGMRSGIEEAVVVSDDTLGVTIDPGIADIEHVYAYRHPVGNVFQKGVPGINQNQHSATSCAPAATAQCLKYYEGQGDAEITGGLNDVDLLFGLATTMRTNVDTVGTPLSNWINGTRRWVEEHGNGYTVRSFRHFTEGGVSTWTRDDWVRIRDGLQRCNDVLLGLYWSGGGGHAVTLDGISHDLTPQGRHQIDFRDPWTGTIQYAEIDTASGFVQEADGLGQEWTAFLGTSLIVAPRELDVAFGYPGDLVYDGPLPEGPPYVIPVELLEPGYYMIQLIGVNARGHAHTLTGTVRRLLPQDVDDAEQPPSALSLGPCSPNPFHKETEIVYAIPAATTATIEVYSVAGRRVRTIFQGEAESGVHRVVWNGRDNSGKEVPAGIYYIRLSTSMARIVRSVTMIR